MRHRLPNGPATVPARVTAAPSVAASPAWRAAAIILLTFVAYLPALRAGFVWDDDTHLINNVVLQDWGLYRAWFTAEPPNYWPLTWSSYWLEHQLWGLEPFGYHLTNLLLHTASSLLMWQILLRLGIPCAWLSALLFAIHPVNVESVAWIAQRKNALSLIFYLLAVLLYLRFEDRHDLHLENRHDLHLEDSDGARSYRLAVVSFLCSMLAKGAAATMPVVLLILAWWRRGAIRGLDVRRSLPFFAIAAAMSGVEIAFQYLRSIGDTVVRTDNFFARLAGAGWEIWFYAYKALWPTDLCFIYPRWNIDPTSWLSYLPGVAAAGLLALAWRFRTSWGRPLVFGLGYFIVTLAPVLGFIDFYFLRYSFVADHYQYVSIIGVIALATAGGATLLGRAPAAPWLGRALAASVVAALMLLSWQRSLAFYDAETLWRDTIAKNPNDFTAHYNLASRLYEAGDTNAAMHHYRQALRIWPASPTAHNNLGIALRSQGHLDAAIQHFERALETTPRAAEPHSNLASTLLTKGRVEEAIQHFRAALASNPTLAGTHRALGIALQSQQHATQAAHHLREALRLDPESPATLNALALLLATSASPEVRDPAEALRLARRASALTKRPKARTLHALAVANAALGHFDAARQNIRAAQNLAEATGQQQLAAEIRKHRDRIEAGAPIYGDPARPSAPPSP
jgi:tetratricopeptide (TPR) repeat protein